MTEWLNLIPPSAIPLLMTLGVCLIGVAYLFRHRHR